jgi:hypothetical protein
MTIVYCDWTSGNDSTGDGSAGNPYKTITQASTGLSGGDEVRVAKSPAHTTLSQTLSWTDNSASVGTTGDLTGELAANDMIGKDADDGMWWEISSINSTTITLTGVYSGTTETVTSYKLGFHDCGSPAATTTNVQVITNDGTSASSRLKISGGWDLTTETVTGVSAFCVTHATNRYGIGLYGLSKDSIDLENLIFCRFYDNLYWSNAHYSTLTDIVCCTPGRRVYLTGNSLRIISMKINGGVTASSNALSVDGYDWLINDLTVVSFSGSVAYAAISSTVVNLTVAGTLTLQNITNYGMYCAGNLLAKEMVFKNCGRGIADIYSAYGSTTNVIGKLTATNNTVVIYWGRWALCKIGTYIPSGNTTEFYFPAIYVGKDPHPMVTVQRWNNTEGDCRAYYYNAVVSRDTAEARSGACVKVDPSSADYYSHISLGKFLITETGSDITLTIYAKDDAAFNGEVGLMALVNNQIAVELTAKTMDTSYGAHTLTVPAASLVDNEWIELVARVQGSAGNVYFDDFSAA